MCLARYRHHALQRLFSLPTRQPRGSPPKEMPHWSCCSCGGLTSPLSSRFGHPHETPSDFILEAEGPDWDLKGTDKWRRTKAGLSTARASEVVEHRYGGRHGERADVLARYFSGKGQGAGAGQDPAAIRCRPDRPPARLPVLSGHSYCDWMMSTIHGTPNLSTHIPNSSPQACFWNGIVVVPPDESLSQ